MRLTGKSRNLQGTHFSLAYRRSLTQGRDALAAWAESAGHDMFRSLRTDSSANRLLIAFTQHCYDSECPYGCHKFGCGGKKGIVQRGCVVVVVVVDTGDQGDQSGWSGSQPGEGGWSGSQPGKGKGKGNKCGKHAITWHGDQLDFGPPPEQ